MSYSCANCLTPTNSENIYCNICAQTYGTKIRYTPHSDDILPYIRIPTWPWEVYNWTEIGFFQKIHYCGIFIHAISRLFMSILVAAFYLICAYGFVWCLAKILGAT